MKFFGVLVSAALCAAAAHAQSWPGSRPIKLESGSAAGGIVDLVARELSKNLSTSLGVPVVVEDRPGGGGNIAAAVVAKANPDGHTLLVTSLNQAVNPILLPDPGFDYKRDLVPVSMVVVAKLLLVAAPAFPAKDIRDVVAIAKRKPKSISIAFSVIGTPSHLAAEMLAQFGGIDLTFVPYGGGAQAIPDVVSNRVNLAISTLPTFLPQVQSGALKPLAILSPQRTPLAPDVATAAESGLPALQLGSWICVMATGGTPAPIVANLDAEIAKLLLQPEVRDAFGRWGIEIFHLDPQQLGVFLDSEAARFGSLLKHSRVAKPLH